MDDLRERVIEACWSYTEQEEYSMGRPWAEDRADVVLSEIGTTHVLIEKGLASRMALAARASDCFDERGRPCIRSEDWPMVVELSEREEITGHGNSE